jgi:hypothetical protein
MSQGEKFIGTWRLLRTQFSKDDGTSVESPYGSDPEGILMYDEQGNMAAQIARKDRRQFAVADRKGGDDWETRAAFETYQAYWGTYRIDEAESVITHTVTQALLPNWTGGEQRRHYRISDGELVLRTPPMRIGGELVSGELVWEKVG